MILMLFSEELQAFILPAGYQYKDSFACEAIRSQGYQLTLATKLLYEGKYDEAIGVLEGCYDIHSQKDFSLAIPSVALASVYGAKGDHKQEKKYLTISAIADVPKRNKGIHFALETCQPALWRGRHRTCVYLYGMLHARCYLL